MTAGHIARTEQVVRARTAALRLVGAVRDNDALGARAIVLRSDPTALLLALASLVDDRRQPSELLSWVEPDPALDGLTWHEALAAHRQYEAARSRGEQHLLPAHVWQGQRVYDRQRKRERRRRQAS